MKSSPLAGCHIRFLCFTMFLNFMNDSLKYFKVSLITKTHLPNVFLLALHLWQFWIQNHLGDRPLDMSLSVHRGTYPQCCWYYSKAELFDSIKRKIQASTRIHFSLLFNRWLSVVSHLSHSLAPMSFCSLNPSKSFLMSIL